MLNKPTSHVDLINKQAETFHNAESSNVDRYTHYNSYKMKIIGLDSFKFQVFIAHFTYTLQ